MRLRGVLTYADSIRGDAFLYDGTESVYLYACQPAAVVRALNRVEVSGQSAAGLYAPIVVFGKAESQGAAIWPTPERVPFVKFASGTMDAQWIEIDAVLRSAIKRQGNWFVSLAATDGRFDAWLPDEPGGSNPIEWIDAKLRLRGNCGAHLDPKNRFESPFLFVPGRRAVEVLEPPPDPFATSVRTIASLNEFKAGDQGQHRIRIQGVVTWCNASNEFTLQDDTGGARIRLADGPPSKTGDSLDVVAFPTRTPSDRSMSLEEAVVRRTGARRPPEPKAVKIADLDQGAADNELAAVEGRLLAMVDQSSWLTYYMDADGRAFTAQLSRIEAGDARTKTHPSPGSWLRLTGTVRLLPDLKPAPDSIQIRLRGPADIAIVTTPPWWTWRHSLISLGVLSALTMAAGAWIATLRSTIAAQSRQVQAKMDKELAMAAQLRQSQKMEAVGQLAGGIAHDFNNLLQVIQGNAHIGAMEIGPGNPAAEPLAEICRATERASALVRQLLTFSRNVPHRIERLDIGGILKDLTTMLRHLIGSHIRLEVRIASGVQPICADRGQIEQVLINLCINARDAMPGGGCIQVEARPCPPGDVPAPASGAEANSRFVCVSVRDTGHGIPPEIQHRIFEPFFTTKEVGKGTGLGLSTVYAIIHDLQGSIEVKSDFGHGATFLFYLPAAPEKPETEPPEPVALPAGAVRGECILLAEDEEKIRVLASRILSRAGYRVICAGDGEEAIRLIERHAAELDLAILDIVMPRKSGGAVYRELRERWPGIACLFASGYSFDALKQLEIPEGEVPLLPKPYIPELLLQTVRRILDKRAASEKP